jgi:hypothetical protein
VWLCLGAACGAGLDAPGRHRALLEPSSERTVSSPGPSLRPAGNQQYEVSAVIRDEDGLVTWVDGRRDARYFTSVHARRFLLDGGGGEGPTELVVGALREGEESVVVAFDGGLYYSTRSRARVLAPSGASTGPLPRGLLVTAGPALYSVALTSGELTLAQVHDGGLSPRAAIRSVSTLLATAGHAQGVTALVRRSDGGTWLAQAPLDGGRFELSLVSPAPLGDEATLVTDGRMHFVAHHQPVPLADGGSQTRVQLDVLWLDGGQVATLQPFDGGSTSPSLCFNGTAVLLAFMEPLGCCRGNVWTSALSASAVPLSAAPPRLLDTNWDFEPTLACDRNRQVVFWGQWNYVESSAAAQLVTVLDSTGARASPSRPISTSGQPQYIVAATDEWVHFRSPPQGDFVASMVEQADASVAFSGDVLASGLDGGWAQLSTGAGGLRLELRTATGSLTGSVVVSPSMPATASLLRAPSGWVVAWSEAGAMMTARVDDALRVSGRQPLPLPSVRGVAMTGNAVMVTSDSPYQVRWSTTRADGGVFSVNTSNYWVESTVGAVGDRFVLAWPEAGLRVAWVGEDGRLTSQPRSIGASDSEATAPAIACGRTSCLLTYVQWSPTTAWDIVGEWLVPDGGSSGPFALRVDARSETDAFPVFVSEGHWRLAYNRYEPALATKRAVVVDLFERSASDAGVLDAGVLDAGVLDAGALDAGTLDAGTLDAGTLDAGTLDAGTLDAGVLDAGEVDADGGAGEARRYSVGCGAGPGGPGLFAVMVALLLLRTARASRHR